MTLVSPGLYEFDELRDALNDLLDEIRRAGDPTPRLLLAVLEMLPRLAIATAEQGYRVGWARGFERGRKASKEKTP